MLIRHLKAVLSTLFQQNYIQSALDTICDQGSKFKDLKAEHRVLAMQILQESAYSLVSAFTLARVRIKRRLDAKSKESGLFAVSDTVKRLQSADGISL